MNLNVIPRDGGNTFRGSVFGNTARGWMQASNFTQSLKDQGLRTPAELNNLYDVDAMGGGRIVRDKLWFYLTARQVVSKNTVPGMWVNKNADNPNLWAVDFDLSQPAFTDTQDRHEIVRLTWQASQTPQAYRLLAGAAQLHRQGRRRHADADARGHRLDQFHNRPASSRAPGRLRSTTSCWRRPGSGPTWGFTTRAAVADRASAVSAASTTRR